MEHTNFIIQDSILKMYHGINKHVVIPEGVMEIGDEAFEDNQFIQVIEVPSTLVKIDAWLFYGCCCLKDIIIMILMFCDRLCVYKQFFTVISRWF